MASPTSGLVLRRDLALRLIPLPTQNVRTCADDFMVRGAALLGHVTGIPDVLATYRVHGDNARYDKAAPKSQAFVNALDEHLNRKLVEAGKMPVIDFCHSMYAREFIPQSASELSRLAVSVFRHHANLVTLKFLLTTLARALQRAMPPASSPCANEN
jgi:hypothetical protein